MSEPEFDADGYPTEATLEAIENWPYQDIAGCLDFCRSAWHWGADCANEAVNVYEANVLYAKEGDRYARFATGGWSGNEDIICALRANAGIQLFAWRLSAHGGLHIYQYPETQ